MVTPPPADVTLPERMLGITPGPALDGYQYLTTIHVQLADGDELKLAVSYADLLNFVTNCEAQGIYARG